MQLHVKRKGTARIEKRWLDMGCLNLAVEGKILKRETWTSPALVAVAFVMGSWVLPLVGLGRLWIVTERGIG